MIYMTEREQRAMIAYWQAEWEEAIRNNDLALIDECEWQVRNLRMAR